MARNRKPQLGIDARFFGPGGKGLGRYTERLIQHLERRELPFDVVLFLRDENWDAFQSTNPAFRKVRAPFRWYTLAEQLRFPLLLGRERLDLVHFPHFNVPLWYRGAFLVTIHDLILTKYPTERATTLGPALYRLKHAASQVVLRSAARRAKRVITVSEFSAKDVEETLAVSKNKIRVIPLGCEPLAPADAVEAPRVGFGMPDKYVVYVGNAYPHKNLEKLIEAWAILRQRGRPESLVLVGKMDYFFERLRRRVIERGYDRGDARVIFPGYVSDGQLRWLYQRASLYAFPSLIEGFGLPGLEAMSEGCPVVAARSSCLPEIYGEAALYFDPHDAADIARTMLEVLSSPETRASVIERGKRQVLSYHWETMSAETLAVYQELLY